MDPNTGKHARVQGVIPALKIPLLEEVGRGVLGKDEIWMLGRTSRVWDIGAEGSLILSNPFILPPLLNSYWNPCL